MWEVGQGKLLHYDHEDHKKKTHPFFIFYSMQIAQD